MYHVTRACAVMLMIEAAFAAVCSAAGPLAVRSGPDGWRAEAPRLEIAPEFSVTRAEDGRDALVIDAGSSEAAYGWWVNDYDVEPGKWYRLQVRYTARSVSLPRRSVLVRLTRFDAAGHKMRQPEYPATMPPSTPSAPATIEGVYDMPADCARVQVELVLRWAPGSRVEWQQPELVETTAPAARNVRLATIRYCPRQRTAGPDENRRRFGEMIDRAALQHPDLVVLGEGITVVSTGRTYVDVAEPVPGPTTAFLGGLSRRHDMYIVAGLYERDGAIVYNTAVLLGPDGELVGKYRKACLPREESGGGLTPGGTYPVFTTRFGKVGMMVCWDVHFPEVARRLAINGAEVICLPIWGGNDKLAQARAIENQVHLVTSSYNPRIRSAIFDPYGEALAVATDDAPIAVVEVDLARQYLYPYLGDFRARIPRERPPADQETCPGAATSDTGSDSR